MRSCGIKRLYVQVLDVRAVIGEAPGNAVVMSDHDEWRAWPREALGIEAGSGQMDLVPNRRHGEFEVRVIREQWFAGRRVVAADLPFVATYSFANVAL